MSLFARGTNERGPKADTRLYYTSSVLQPIFSILYFFFLFSLSPIFLCFRFSSLEREKKIKFDDFFYYP